jgi:hypothetical protein
MHWRCPACSTIILHAELDTTPGVGEPYRCHLCRVELQFDNSAQRLIVPPGEREDYVGRHKLSHSKTK